MESFDRHLRLFRNSVSLYDPHHIWHMGAHESHPFTCIQSKAEVALPQKNVFEHNSGSIFCYSLFYVVRSTFERLVLLISASNSLLVSTSLQNTQNLSGINTVTTQELTEMLYHLTMTTDHPRLQVLN